MIRLPFSGGQRSNNPGRIYTYVIIITSNDGKSNNLTAINIFRYILLSPDVYYIYIIAYNVRFDNIFQKIVLKSGVNSLVALLPS